MRRAMICVSVMLALLQVWPMLFGRKLPSTAAVAAVAPRIAPKAPRVLVAATMTVPENCAQHYRRASGACATGDPACQAGATDKWDLCEATGFWRD